MAKQKLEFTWIGKESQPKLEPHILPEDTPKSYCQIAKKITSLPPDYLTQICAV